MSATDGTAVLTGGCLCGAVRYAIAERPLGVVNCHCSQCRRFHGHVGAYVSIPRGTVRITGEKSVSWYRSSATARRGFCRTCGSSLFWSGEGQPLLDVAAGTLDEPTGLTTLRHIFVASKGDYYAIADGLECFEASAPEPP
ncbi:GFA family protein [Azospirillum halopraeferens]|uniref:GFA family protein n=1 Tax=Azospirillum halopraeferens TaxID=34010 RepID=UPI0004905A1A|nr:GFA family protein [Azospirillum halopraeferens]